MPMASFARDPGLFKMAMGVVCLPVPKEGYSRFNLLSRLEYFPEITMRLGQL